MTTAISKGNLQALAGHLQESLQTTLPALPMQVQCALKQADLFILVQHPPDESLAPQGILTAVQQSMAALPATAIAQIYQPQAVPDPCLVKLYLRRLGADRPYRFYQFDYHLPETEAVLSQPAERPDSPEPLLETSPPLTDSANPEDAPTLLDPPVGEVALDAHEAGLLGEAGEAATGEVSVMGLEDAVLFEQGSSEIESPMLDPADLELPGQLQTFPEASPASLSEADEQTTRKLPVLAISLGVGVLGLLGGMGWVFTRPCMMGSCPPIETAQQLNQETVKQAQTAQSPEDLQKLAQQLVSTNQQLASIPIWSTWHVQANALLQTSQVQSEALNRMVVAAQKAAEAVQKGTSATSSTDTQAVETLWREAIAQLEGIPSSNPLYPTAQQRLAMYRGALANTERQLVADQQAVKQIASAKSTAQLATSRQAAAKSPEQWQLAQATWQVAVNTVQRIPPSSHHYAEAQQLLTDYQPKLAAVRDRTAQELLGKQSYTQAVSLSQTARRLEQQNQWSQATTTWRQALNAAQKVPKGTFFFEQAQPLIPTYETALKQSSAQLQAAVGLQKVRTDLQRVCAGSPTICTFTISSDRIRVQLTRAYERAARTAFIVGQGGDVNTLGGVMQHLDSLKDALQVIANNAGLPMDVYNSENDQVAAFEPQ
jgi:hypothetical protein